jgi:hypothetical protein
MTNHFNQLTEAEQERLSILIEECSEVQQIGCKILRHGYESYSPKSIDKETNREALQRELGDLMHALGRMLKLKDLDHTKINERQVSKAEHVKPYLHHNEA